MIFQLNRCGLCTVTALINIPNHVSGFLRDAPSQAALSCVTAAEIGVGQTQSYSRKCLHGLAGYYSVL